MVVALYSTWNAFVYALNFYALSVLSNILSTEHGPAVGMAKCQIMLDLKMWSEAPYGEYDAIA